MLKQVQHDSVSNIMKNKGFTLVEVMVAIGISVLVIGGMTAILSYSFKSNKIVWEQLSTQNEGRKAVAGFTNELRGSNNSSLGAYAVAEAGAQQIIFYSNIDSDSYIEKIRYYKSGNLLVKGITKPTGNPLVYNVATETTSTIVRDIYNGANPLFYYYDQSATISSTPMVQPVGVTSVRVVKISLDIEEDPQASPAPFHIESKVQIRNLKTN